MSLSRPRPRAKQCVKRTRPDWWTPETVCGLLQEGEYVGDLCVRASSEMEEMGDPVKASVLRSEISKWANSASWGEQITRALRVVYKDARGRMVHSKDWHDDFINAMYTNAGNPERAAEASGIGYGVVMAVLDKRNRCYDPEFAERFRIAEAERVAGIRAAHFQVAEGNNPLDLQTRVKVQKDLLATHAPGLHGSRAELHVTGKVDHDHDHTHEHTHRVAGGLAREVVMASQSRVKGLMAGRTNGGNGDLPMLPAGMSNRQAREEGRVIDVTPVRETAHGEERA